MREHEILSHLGMRACI